MTYILPDGCRVRPLTGIFRGKEGVVVYYNPWRRTHLVRFETGTRPEYEHYKDKDLEVIK